MLDLSFIIIEILLLKNQKYLLEEKKHLFLEKKKN